MEGLEEIRGAEGEMEPEFHEIPSQGPSQTSQAEYIHAPAQGLPSTNDFSRVLDTPSKVNYTNQPALTILFKMLGKMGNHFLSDALQTESVARRVYGLTGVTVE